MQDFKRWAATAAAVGVLAAAGVAATPAAAATTRQMTFSGQVQSLNDGSHLFGPTAFGDLADHSFTATFGFDLPSAGELKSGGVDILAGGSQIFRPAFVSGRLTFAGVTHVFASERFGSVGVGGGAAGATVRGLVDGEQEDLTLNANLDFINPGDLGFDFTAMLAPLDTGSGFRAWNVAGRDAALGVLFVDRVSVGDAPATPAAVPEPAAWALMIAGFGMAGAGLRRRRAGAAAIR
jgi:hypothetical protein